MISLKGFCKSYSSHPAVINFDMECKTGSITGILGPNGAGKTTILKAVTARHFGDEGTVYVENADAKENIQFVRNITGFVMENPDLPGEYYVYEYLKSVAELHGVSKDDIQENLNNVKKLCSLEEVWCKKINELSKGYKERVNFAQALVYNPKVLVLDEPASGLDPEQILRMRELVKSLKKDHTILLSTHLMQEVDALCDYIYIISKGTCVAHGTSEQIARDNDCSNLEKAFFKLINGGNEK